ncbi:MULTISPECIES: hypothetical protein [unclassified Erythrobacter]|uniref:hypothetical protein n=1 Tax=unclassified Erythrobacter TaxID=2633097 RepID=UPI001F226D69|nr:MULTISPECIES: hypothetical protein [unclassified Erythrobacter]
MSSTIKYNTADFFQVEKKGGSGWAEDRENGASIFLRLGDGARIELVAKILDAWLDEENLNRGMAAGALRHAWDSEPYTGGVRVGSYVTSAVARLRDGDVFSMDEFIEEWGESLMSEAEERELKAMDFPLTVYRGGTGTVEEVTTGISWTLKPEIASFYANEWPQRWGDAREPVIVSAKVDEGEVFAFLNDRGEAEMLIPYPDQIDTVGRVTGSQ